MKAGGQTGPLQGRGLLITMVILFGICFLQATYWILDQTHYSSSVHTQMVELLQEETQWANEALDPSERAQFSARHPHLEERAGVIEVDGEMLARLDRNLVSRLNRYLWEGGFFLVVLVLGTFVMARTLRQHGQLLRRQRNFLASVGHELKSPLASIKLSAETLDLRELPSEQVKRLSGRMLGEVSRLEGFINNIMETARLDAGTRKLNRQRLALLPVLQEVIEEVQARHPQVPIELQVRREGNILADNLAARSVVQNLIDNACKSVSAAKGGTVQVQLTGDDSLVRLEVHDTGMGFDAKETDRLFERFYRVGDELTRNTKGSGLGLYIARSAMTLEGGRLVASSDGPGHGASFVAEWPRSQEAESPLVETLS